MTAQGGYEWLYKPIEQNAANALIQSQTSSVIKTITPNGIYTEPIAEPVESINTDYGTQQNLQ